MITAAFLRCDLFYLCRFRLDCTSIDVTGRIEFRNEANTAWKFTNTDPFLHGVIPFSPLLFILPVVSILVYISQRPLLVLNGIAVRQRTS